jgi:K+-transporting ATPase ATPase C chain
MKKQISIALKFLIVITLLTGLVYPLLLTGIAQVVFPEQANGSIIMKDGKIMGSKLIGQKFDSSAYFWSRPSTIDYNPIPSGASNFGPTSSKLLSLVNERRNTFITGNYLKDSAIIPGEMLFASGSGLDPHTSLDAVLLQANRIATVRHFNSSQKQNLDDLIRQNTERRQYGILGEERVNIVLLNSGLDEIK